VLIPVLEKSSTFFFFQFFQRNPLVSR